MFKISKLKKLIRRPKAELGLGVAVAILALISLVSVLWPAKPMPAQYNLLAPNRPQPVTGVSIIFNPPLSDTANVKINNSAGKQVKAYTLERSSHAVSGRIIANAKGDRYNIPLSEGVYSFTISGDKDIPMPITETVTVSDHKLTTLNMGLIGRP